MGEFKVKHSNYLSKLAAAKQFPSSQRFLHEIGREMEFLKRKVCENLDVVIIHFANIWTLSANYYVYNEMYVH